MKVQANIKSGKKSMFFSSKELRKLAISIIRVDPVLSKHKIF